MEKDCYLIESIENVDARVDYKQIINFFVNNHMGMEEQAYHREISATLIDFINEDENKEVIYNMIYFGTIEPIVKSIYVKDYEKAKAIYDMNRLSLEKLYINKDKTKEL